MTNIIIGDLIMAARKNNKEIIEELRYYKEMYEEHKLILDYIYDFISVADGEGNYLRLNKPCFEIFGVSEDEIIGVNASDIEKKGIVKATMTNAVINSNKEETMVQETSTGKKLLVTGIPIIEKGRIKKVINISRDITDIENLNKRLKETTELLEWYRSEIYKKQEIMEVLVEGKSLLMKRIYDFIDMVSNIDTTVLLSGETGTGKTSIAKIIHKRSKRAEKPFIHVNCGAIPDNLLESEFFGYVEGAFTGASRKGKKGYFEMANGGTIFLDEISEIPIHLQVKLLHALEESQIYRVGGVAQTKINVRIIAATNKDLQNMVREGRFREDLYYRLNVLSANIPSLRNRKEDLPDLVNHLLSKYNNKYSLNKKLSPKSYEIFLSYSWPGNIRELEHTIERLVITSSDSIINEKNVLNIIQKINDNKAVEVRDIIPLKEAVEETEKQLLIKAMEKYKTTRKASEALCIDQSTVVKKLQKLKKK